VQGGLTSRHSGLRMSGCVVRGGRSRIPKSKALRSRCPPDSPFCLAQSDRNPASPLNQNDGFHLRQTLRNSGVTALDHRSLKIVSQRPAHVAELSALLAPRPCAIW